MKTLYIGFSRPKKFAILSKLIRLVQNTEYSHVYVKFYSNSLERDLIYQASGLQVNFTSSKIFNEHQETVKEFCLEVSEEAYKKSLQFAVDQAGTPYSIKQLFSILVYMVSGKILYKDSRNAYICSELIGQMLSEDYNIKISKDLDIITPKDIYEILSE